MQDGHTLKKAVNLMARSMSLRQEKRLEDALACLDEALRIAPDFFLVLTDRGEILNELGRHEESLDCFDRLLEFVPNLSEIRLLREKTLQGAKAKYEEMRAANPKDGGILYKLGNILQRMSRHEDAVHSYNQALERDPGNKDVLNNLGNALLELNRHEEALDSYNGALAKDHDNEIALFNRGIVLQQLGRMDEAIDSYRRALLCGTDFPEATLEQSHCRLAMGDYGLGWRQYEARWKTVQLKGRKLSSSKPLWLGKEDITGKTVLLWAEQGFGDTIQFLRYVPLAAQKAGKVILRVPVALRALSETLRCSISIVTLEDHVPFHDFQCPLMSLPLAFGTELGSIPADIPYLGAAADEVNEWHHRLGARFRPRIGLAWAGRRRQPINRTRDLPLEALRPLMDMDLEIISLQKEIPEEDRATLESIPQINSLGEMLEDFSDAASLIENLDLVISADTAVAHLAGALGKPVWIMLRHSGEWRWLLNRSDSPWYPSATIFRQKNRGNWDGVVREIMRELLLFRNPVFG
jgi:tetratricopeptide (TPR) repeat protein